MQQRDAADRIRAFNRDWMATFGLMSRDYLGTGLGVAQVRVLYELAHVGDTGPSPARQLAARLGLDEGYLSRTLTDFERRGWLVRDRDGQDHRSRTMRLTKAGRLQAAACEARSQAEVAARLGDLTPDRQAALLDGLSVARAALVGAEKAVLSPGLRPGDAGWVIARHGALYAAEEGYDQRFEVLVAGIVVDFVTRAAAGARGEAAILARTGRGPVGCVFVVREDDMTARLRLFLVEPAHRGTGLGHRLLDEALTFARAAGYRRMVLWTHASHRAACALYARAGFAIESEAAAHAFGQPVIDQTWSRAL